jgi:hypothetical protein
VCVCTYVYTFLSFGWFWGFEIKASANTIPLEQLPHTPSLLCISFSDWFLQFYLGRLGTQSSFLHHPNRWDLQVCIIFFNSFIDDGHICWYHSLAMRCLYCKLTLILWGIYADVIQLDNNHSPIFNFLRNIDTDIQSNWTQLHSHQQCIGFLPPPLSLTSSHVCCFFGNTNQFIQR